MTSLEAEALRLAKVLRSMVECGNSPEDLWELDQPDGDPFVVRAAELLETLAAETARPTNDEVFDRMTRLDPSWNAYGRSRSVAVELALTVFRVLLHERYWRPN